MQGTGWLVIVDEQTSTAYQAVVFLAAHRFFTAFNLQKAVDSILGLALSLPYFVRLCRQANGLNRLLGYRQFGCLFFLAATQPGE